MQVKFIKRLYTARTPGGKSILGLFEATVEKDNRQFPYFYFVRGENDPPPPEQKKPNAVIIVAIREGVEPALVLVDEFRPPIGCREISFPAGLIDAEDWEGRTEGEGIRRAAVREFKEETGMDLVSITEVSPHNLYSTAGITNESSVYVFGYAEGAPSAEYLDRGEDIRVILAIQADIIEIMEKGVCSRVMWPFLWGFRRSGIKF